MKSWDKEPPLKKIPIDPKVDFDYVGARLNNSARDPGGHWPDAYKLANHITYSTEALASKLPGAKPAGEWGREKGKDVFRATQANVDNAGGVENLRDYFRKKEPDVKLVIGFKKGNTVKKVRKFDAGGMASSSPQPAFTQFGATPPAFGSGMVGGMANTADTGVGGVRAAPTPAMAQAPAMTPTAPTPAMRKGGAVKKLAVGGPTGGMERKTARFNDRMERKTTRFNDRMERKAVRKAEPMRPPMRPPGAPAMRPPGAPAMPPPGAPAMRPPTAPAPGAPAAPAMPPPPTAGLGSFNSYARPSAPAPAPAAPAMRKGGAVKKYSKGGAVTSRGDGCCSKGKTKGRVC